MKTNNPENYSIIPMLIAVLVTFAIGCSVDMFVPSLPYIAKQFSASATSTRLIVTVYIIAYGVMQLFTGSLTDSFGRRKILILGLAGYTTATFLITTATSIHILLLLRALQGCFAAGMGVVARTLLSDCYTGKKLSKYVTYLVVAWAAGPIISPFIGGYLQEIFNWQASFLALATYGLVLLFIVSFLLPETLSQKYGFRLNVIVKNYKSIFSHSTFMISAAICGLGYGLITIYNVLGPFLIESVLHYNAVVYGRIALVLGLAWLSGALILRVITGHSHMNKIFSIILFIALSISMIMLIAGLLGKLNLWICILPPAIILTCMSIVFTYSFGKSLSIFPNMGGSASAAVGSLSSLVAGIMSGIASMLNANSLLPLSGCYIILISIIMLLYYGGKRVSQKTLSQNLILSPDQ